MAKIAKAALDAARASITDEMLNLPDGFYELETAEPIANPCKHNGRNDWTYSREWKNGMQFWVKTVAYGGGVVEKRLIARGVGGYDYLNMSREAIEGYEPAALQLALLLPCLRKLPPTFGEFCAQNQISEHKSILAALIEAGKITEADVKAAQDAYDNATDEENNEFNRKHGL